VFFANLPQRIIERDEVSGTRVASRFAAFETESAKGDTTLLVGRDGAGFVGLVSVAQAFHNA
jgi:hypothetical protein